LPRIDHPDFSLRSRRDLEALQPRAIGEGDFALQFDFGANVINISAGQFSSRGEASRELRAAIEPAAKTFFFFFF